MKRIAMRLFYSLTVLILGLGAAFAGKAVADYQKDQKQKRVVLTPEQLAVKREVTSALETTGLRLKAEIDPNRNYALVMDVTNIDRRRRVYFQKQDDRWVFGCPDHTGQVFDMLADSDTHLHFLLYGCTGHPGNVES